MLLVGSLAAVPAAVPGCCCAAPQCHAGCQPCNADAEPPLVSACPRLLTPCCAPWPSHQSHTQAVARQVPEEDRAAGALMPPTASLRELAGACSGCSTAGLAVVCAACERSHRPWGHCTSASCALQSCLPPLPPLARPCSPRGGGGGHQSIQCWGRHRAAAAVRPGGQRAQPHAQPAVPALPLSALWRPVAGPAAM